MKKKRKSTDSRIAFMILLFALMGILILARLFYIQIIKNKEYTKMALEQMTKSEDIVSARGDIYDRNGKKLAINVNASTIYVNAQHFGNSDTKVTKDQIASALSKPLDMEVSDLLELLNTDKRVKVKQWVDQDVAMEIKELGLQLVEVIDGSRRFYPFGNSASHLLGFTNVDNVGQYGIEAAFDKELAGKPGKWLKTVDANQRQLPLAKEEVYEANDGMSLVLTLDKSIQEIVDSVARETYVENGANGVSIIVQDTQTGDILGMANYPEYNLNFPKEPVNEEQSKEWKDLASDELEKEWYSNWRNFAINDIYESGSTFKIITAAAALEQNTTNPNQHYYCTGFIRDIKGEILECIDTHGDITLKEGLAKSCNSVFVNVARELTAEEYYKYIKSFGFGEKTGIALPSEQKGIIPASADVIKPINLATLSYGYGIAITPIQLINATSAIANGGKLMVPRVAKEMVNSNGNVVESFPVEVKRQVLSESTSKTMLEMMYNVVEAGSGANAKVEGYRIGGKTGTAKKLKPDGSGYVDNEFYASFVGVAPIDNPKITVLVIVDNPSGTYWGSTVAAPAAKKIFEGTLEYLGIQRDDRIIEESKSGEVKVPDVSGMLIGDAGKVLSGFDLKHTIEYGEVNDYSIVETQSPKAGEVITRGGIVDLTLVDSEKRVVPKLLGKTIEEASEILKAMNIDFEVEGEGLVAEQSLAAGTEIEVEEKLQLKLDVDYVGEFDSKLIQNIKDDSITIKPKVKEPVEEETEEEVEEEVEDQEETEADKVE